MLFFVLVFIRACSAAGVDRLQISRVAGSTLELFQADFWEATNSPKEQTELAWLCHRRPLKVQKGNWDMAFSDHRQTRATGRPPGTDEKWAPRAN